MSEYITKKTNKLKNLGRAGKGLSKNVLDNIKEEDIFKFKDSDIKIVLPSKKYKKGGLVKKGKPKLAKKGWK
jgi:hypothetical protein